MALALTLVASIANTLYQPGIASAASTEGIVSPNAILVHADIDVRNHTDPLTGIDIRVECSLDGGVTWNFVIGAHRDGGTITDKNSVAIPNTTLEIGLPGDPSMDRRVRMFVDITGSPLVLNGTLSTG